MLFPSQQLVAVENEIALLQREPEGVYWTADISIFQIVAYSLLYFGRINEIIRWRATHIAKHLHR